VVCEKDTLGECHKNSNFFNFNLSKFKVKSKQIHVLFFIPHSCPMSTTMISRVVQLATDPGFIKNSASQHQKCKKILPEWVVPSHSVSGYHILTSISSFREPSNVGQHCGISTLVSSDVDNDDVFSTVSIHTTIPRMILSTLMQVLLSWPKMVHCLRQC
jgi:hypothetical protein